MSERPPDAGADRVPPVDDRLPWLRERLAEAPGLLLGLDFDGTLARIDPDPGAVEPLPGVRDALSTLRDRPGVEVGVISGRALADLRDRVGVDGIHYVGNHGVELMIDGEGSVADEAAAVRPQLERALERLRTELGDVGGVEIEDKEFTATVHYRGVPEPAVEGVRATVRAVLEEFDGLRLTRGKRVLEIRPDVPLGKDRAVRRLRERYPEYLPVFVGDDVTDEDGFRAVAEDGVGVHVGDRADTAASLRVGGPDGVLEFLEWLAAATAERTEPDSG